MDQETQQQGDFKVGDLVRTKIGIDGNYYGCHGDTIVIIPKGTLGRVEYLVEDEADPTPAPGVAWQGYSTWEVNPEHVERLLD